MFDLFEKIDEAIRELLTNFISSNLTTMFTDVNTKTGTIASEVGQTPQGWNGSIFSMIESLSNKPPEPVGVSAGRSRLRQELFCQGADYLPHAEHR